MQIAFQQCSCSCALWCTFKRVLWCCFKFSAFLLITPNQTKLQTSFSNGQSCNFKSIEFFGTVNQTMWRLELENLLIDEMVCNLGKVSTLLVHCSSEYSFCKCFYFLFHALILWNIYSWPGLISSPVISASPPSASWIYRAPYCSINECYSREGWFLLLFPPLTSSAHATTRLEIHHKTENKHHRSLHQSIHSKCQWEVYICIFCHVCRSFHALQMDSWLPNYLLSILLNVQHRLV